MFDEIHAYFIEQNKEQERDRNKKKNNVPTDHLSLDNIYNINNWILLAENIIIDFMDPNYGYTHSYERSIDYKNDEIYEKKRYQFISEEIFLNLCLQLFKLYETIFEKRWQNEIPQKKKYNGKETSFFYLEKDAVFCQKVIINDVNSRIFFIGDIHSSFHSLIQILTKIKKEGGFSDDNITLKNNFYIFF